MFASGPIKNAPRVPPGPPRLGSVSIPPLALRQSSCTAWMTLSDHTSAPLGRSQRSSNGSPPLPPAGPTRRCADPAVAVITTKASDRAAARIRTSQERRVG
jgi:hypothetical protein